MMVVIALAAVAGAAVAGKGPGGSAQVHALRPTAHASAARHGVAPAPRAATVAPAVAATLEGASALASTAFVIPPPRWLVSHRRLAEPSTRLSGLNWQVDPYMD